MKSNTPYTTSDDLYRSRLDQMINLRHELVILANQIDWQHIDNQLIPLYSSTGRPAISSRLMVGLHLLKQIHKLPNDAV